MQRPLIERLKSRKFLAAFFNFLFVVINELSGTPVSRESYFAVTGGIIAFITGEAYVDGKSHGVKK